MGRAKAIPRENAVHLARVLRPYAEAYPSQTAAAKAWGIAQSHLSQILLAEGKGAGIAVLIRIRKAIGISLDEMLGLEPLEATLVEPKLSDLQRVLREVVRAELDAPRTSAPPPPDPSIPPKKRPSDAPRVRRR